MSGPKASWEGGPDEFKMLEGAMSEAYLILHGPPDLPGDAEILGVCGVSTENADQNKYGWMVADFLHWKLLLHNLGEKAAQTWASSLNISKFLDEIDGVDMADDKIVDIIGRHEDDIMAMPNDSDGFVDTFLRRLAESAHAAVSRRTVLAVMVFAPVTPEQDICVNLDNKQTYLTADRLYRIVNEAVGNVRLPIMLLTPSPFTGGWSCRSMNPPMCPGSDQMMRIIAKSSGGAFARRFIRSFTERNSPLMTDSQRKGIPFDDPMPLRPTALQTDCLRHFQRQIHESLEHRFSVFAQDHAFILSPLSARDPSVFSDTWAEYGPRRGLRFEHWAERWSSTRPDVDHPRRFEFLGEAFGGTRESQLFHLNHLIKTELETNVGDWDRQVGGCTRELYVGFQKSLTPTEDEAKRAFDALEFRASSAIVAQMVVKAFGLPLPDGFKCRYWPDKMDGVNDEHYRKLQYAFGEAHSLFDQAAVLPSENQHQFKNVRFLRAARWLSASIASRFVNGSREDIEAFVCRDVTRFITKIQDAQKALLLEDQAVRRAGLDWIAAIGLGGQTPAADETGLTDQNSPGSRLDAQAAPWSPDMAGQTQHQETTAVTPSTEAEGSIAQSDMKQAAEDNLEYPDTQTAVDDRVGRTWGPVGTPDWTDKPEMESTADNGLDSLKLSPVAPEVPALNSQLNGTDKEVGSSFVSSSLPIQKEPGNNATAWETVTSVPASSFLDVDDNASAWDKILNPPIASNGGQEKKEAPIAFQESENLLDLEEKSVPEPATPIRPEPAAESSLQQALGRLAESLTAVAGEMGASGWNETEYLARVFKKVAETIEEDKDGMAFGSKTMPSASETTSSHSHASFGVNKNHGTSSKWLDAISWRLPQATAKGNEEAKTPSVSSAATSWRLSQGGTGKDRSKVATSSSILDVSPEITDGHPDMGSFNVQKESSAKQNPVHANMSDMQPAAGMGSSGASTDNTESARPAPAQAAATDNQLDDHQEDESNLACGNTFWARAGFKF
ncbi:uncharacterized protein B0H64DRAFT_429696 [Chaetomium fimeti]|uniref:Uncharacterized protein n=1 Tax=Chaetomium fimeti TaxID=1854472 RepID=A0AAE0HL07_9PEZI|nr:hypothetical protein B0H64DRAFT_429696 [Chaetomium fimeti]